jgi:hypothetical protein
MNNSGPLEAIIGHERDKNKEYYLFHEDSYI